MINYICINLDINSKKSLNLIKIGFLFFSIKQVHRISSGTIIDSILQWGVTFETGSNCYQSLLCEHTETSCNAKIVNSIIGILILQ